jgi:hypothetical protein
MPKKGIPPTGNSNPEAGRRTHLRWGLQTASCCGKRTSTRVAHQKRRNADKSIFMAKTYPAFVWQATELNNSDGEKSRAPQAPVATMMPNSTPRRANSRGACS